PYGGITFHLGPPWKDHANALVTRGQSIPLPAVKFNRVYILAAADGDQKGTFRLGNTSVNLNIQDWQGYIGQWNNRTWVEHKFEVPTPPEPAPVAWYASHHHTAQGGNEVYAYCYLFAYSMDIPEGATTLTLPDNEKIRIMAITVADQAGSLRPAQPLYDVLGEARQ